MSASEAPSARAMPSILRKRDFRLFWAGQTISIFGSTVGHFAFALVAVELLGASPGQMGLILALGEGPPIFVGLFVGPLVDRFRRRPLLIGVDLASTVIIGSIPVMYVLDRLTIEWLYATSLAIGLIGAIWWPAWNAFLPSVVDKDRLVDANSKMMLSWSAGGILGPSLGGILVQVLRAPLTMLVDALSFLLSALALARLRTSERLGGDAAETEPILKRILVGLRTAFLVPMQRAVSAPRAILRLIDRMAVAVYVLYAVETVKLSPFALGIVLACGAVGYTLGSVFAGRFERRLGAGNAAIMGLVLVAISPFTMLLADDGRSAVMNVFLLGLPGILGGFGGMIQYVVTSSIRQAITPTDQLGRVHASVSVLGGIMTVLGATLGGVLGESIGLRGTLTVVACAYSIPLLYALVSPLRTATTRGLTH